MKGKVVRHYEIIDRLGGGGMGVVYKARDTRLDRYVALKFLPAHLSSDPDANARFILEAKAASALDHQNICALYDVGESEDGRLFLAMGYYDGDTLKHRLARGPVEPKTALDIAIQICAGLERAHAADIIHRDIKPANLIITSDDRVKILDFGLAKLSGQDLTRAGSTLGTVQYMSPEQSRGDKVDHRTDLWAVGVVLYEMLAGDTPFNADYEQAVVYSILNTDPAPLDKRVTGLPDGLALIVHNCLKKNPAERYQSAAELREDLERIQSGIQPSLSFSRSRVLDGKPGFSRRSVYMGIGVALILAMILLVFSWIGTPPEKRLLAFIPLEVLDQSGAGIEEASILSTGLIESVASQLSRLESVNEQLWILPANEISESMSPSQVAERFQADLVVRGLIQIEEGITRLTLNLVEIKSGRPPNQIDSEQYDYETNSNLIIQDQAVAMVSRMLDIELNKGSETDLAVGGTVSGLANDHYLLGIGYLRKSNTIEDTNRAVEAFEAAIQEDPEFALAFAGLAEALARTYRFTSDAQSYESAVAASNRALELNDSLAPIHLSAGYVQFTASAYEEAIAAFNRGIAIDSTQSELYRQKGRALDRLNRPDEAGLAFKKAIDANPVFWRNQHSLASHYLNLGELDKAEPIFRDMLRKYPSNPSILAGYGVLVYNRDEVKNAIDYFERALAIDPNSSTVSNNIATARYYAGRFEEAESYYRDQLAITPDDDTINAWIGDCLYFQDKKDQARTFFKKAISLARNKLRITPDDDGVLTELGGYYFRVGNLDSTKVILDQVIQKYPSPSEATPQRSVGIGFLMAFAGRSSEAIEWIRNGLEQGQDHKRVKYLPWLEEFRKLPEYRTMMTDLGHVP